MISGKFNTRPNCLKIQSHSESWILPQDSVTTRFVSTWLLQICYRGYRWKNVENR